MHAPDPARSPQPAAQPEPYESSTDRLALALRRWDDPTYDGPRTTGHWSDRYPSAADVAHGEPTVTLTESQVAALVEEGALLAMERLAQDLTAWDSPEQPLGV